MKILIIEFIAGVVIGYVARIVYKRIQRYIKNRKFYKEMEQYFKNKSL